MDGIAMKNNTHARCGAAILQGNSQLNPGE